MLKGQEAGAKTADVCRKHGISSATFYKFKARYGGMDVSDARRLKALEDENARLKKLLAEQMLDNAILKDVAAKMETPDARRKAVALACAEHGVSLRRACKALSVDRASPRYPTGSCWCWRCNSITQAQIRAYRAGGGAQPEAHLPRRA